jgi:hypothetical protein
MKKLALVLVLVAAIAAAGFAQATMEPTLSGSATMTFGVDLGAAGGVAAGIRNEVSAGIELEILEEETVEKGGDGTVYGWIELSDFSIVIDEDGITATAPEISARLYLGPVYIDILGVDDNIDLAGLGAVIQADVIQPLNTASTDYDSEYDGLAVVYDSDMVDVTVFVQSEHDWIDALRGVTYSFTADPDGDSVYDEDGDDVVNWSEITDGADPYDVNTPPQGWAFGATAGVDISGIMVDLAVTMGLNYYDATLEPLTGLGPIGFGAQVGYGLGLGSTTLTPFVGFDGQLYSGAFAMEIGGGVKLTWADMGEDAGEVDLLEESSMAAQLEDTEVTSGVALGASFYNSGAVNDLNIKMALYEDYADDGLIPVLGATAIVNFYNILTAPQLGAGLHVSAELGMIEGFVGTLMWTDAPMTTVQNLELWVGASVEIIDYTTFTLKYVSGNLLAAMPGVITFATKIEF